MLFGFIFFLPMLFMFCTVSIHFADLAHKQREKLAPRVLEDKKGHDGGYLHKIVSSAPYSAGEVTYLFCQVNELIASIFEESFQMDNLLAIDGCLS